MWFNTGGEGSEKAGKYLTWNKLNLRLNLIAIWGKRKEVMSTCCKPLLLLDSHQFSWLPLSSLFISLFCLQSLVLSSYSRFNSIFHLLNGSFYSDILPSTQFQNVKKQIKCFAPQIFYLLRLKTNLINDTFSLSLKSNTCQIQLHLSLK